jgi:hypothetical protein
MGARGLNLRKAIFLQAKIVGTLKIQENSIYFTFDRSLFSKIS